MPRRTLCFFLLLFTACSAPSANQNTKIHIYLGKDSQTVCVSGLEYSILQDLKRDSLSLQSWHALLPVYRMPADTDMKDDQQEQPGIYRVKDSILIFKPDTAFVKHQQYFARFYGNGSPLSPLKVIRAKANLKGPGYMEVVFKF